MRRPGGPGVTGHAPFVGGQTSQSPSGPLQCRAAPHQTTVASTRGTSSPRPPALRLPGTQRAAKDTAGMLLLHGGLLGVDGFADADGLRGTQGAEVRSPPGSLPGEHRPGGAKGSTDRASSCRTGTQAGTGVLASYADPASEDTRSSERGGTRSAEPPGAFGGWGTRMKACAGGSPPPVCDLRALGSPRKARPPGPGERSGRVPVACSGLARLWGKLPDLGPHDTPRTTQAAPTLLRRGPGR